MTPSKQSPHRKHRLIRIQFPRMQVYHPHLIATFDLPKCQAYQSGRQKPKIPAPPYRNIHTPQWQGQRRYFQYLTGAGTKGEMRNRRSFRDSISVVPHRKNRRIISKARLPQHVNCPSGRPGNRERRRAITKRWFG